MKALKVVSLSIAFFVGIMSSIATLANPPHLPDLVRDGNRWTITFYDDSSPTHTQWATQGLCFYYAGTSGTHQRYYWVSDTYPDWNGRATQEGDQIFMHGDFQWPFGTRDGGHDGMEWEVVTRSPKNLGAGHWKEWVEDGRYSLTIGFGNARFERVGKCPFANYEEAREYAETIERSTDENGAYISNPMGIQDEIIQENNK